MSVCSRRSAIQSLAIAAGAGLGQSTLFAAEAARHGIEPREVDVSQVQKTAFEG